MNTKYVYSVVLLIVISAWFGHSTTKPQTSNEPKKKDSKQFISKPVKNITIFGIKSDEWIVGGACNIEFLNDVPMGAKVHYIAKDRMLKLEGWAMDVIRVRLPEQVVVRFTNTENSDYYAISQIGLMRNDVREYFKMPNQLSTSGFELNTNLKDIPVGLYALTLVVKFGDVTYVCNNGRKIYVRLN